MDMQDFRHRIKERPPRKKPGEIACYLPRQFIAKRDEIALSVFFVTNRCLFGLAYSGLQASYFDQMPRDSGVYICVAPQTRFFTSEIKKPGDVDLLIVPYEGKDLIVGRALAIEVKAVRASFLRQGKSPNEFGFAQARGLMMVGFPYVAVAHLIVSDASPVEAWRELGVARILDETGRAEMLEPVLTDCLPIDLIERSFGRLSKSAEDNEIGLVAAYLDAPPDGMNTLWHPATREAAPNPGVRQTTLRRIADLFDRYPTYFFDNPR